LLAVGLARRPGVEATRGIRQVGEAAGREGDLLGQALRIGARAQSGDERVAVAVVGRARDAADLDARGRGAGAARRRGRGTGPRRPGRPPRRLGLAADRAVLDEPVVATEGGHRRPTNFIQAAAGQAAARSTGSGSLAAGGPRGASASPRRTAAASVSRAFARVAT